MSFRNYRVGEHENIKIEEDGPSQLFLSSKFPPGTSSTQEPVLSKIAEVIVSLHEHCLSKCQDLEIYRDLDAQEQ